MLGALLVKTLAAVTLMLSVARGARVFIFFSALKNSNSERNENTPPRNLTMINLFRKRTPPAIIEILKEEQRLCHKNTFQQGTASTAKASFLPKRAERRDFCHTRVSSSTRQRASHV